MPFYFHFWHPTLRRSCSELRHSSNIFYFCRKPSSTTALTYQSLNPALFELARGRPEALTRTSGHCIIFTWVVLQLELRRSLRRSLHWCRDLVCFKEFTTDHFFLLLIYQGASPLLLHVILISTTFPHFIHAFIPPPPSGTFSFACACLLQQGTTFSDFFISFWYVILLGCCIIM